MISKWRWRPPADISKTEEWKVQRSSLGLRSCASAGTWPGRPRSVLAGAALRDPGVLKLGLAKWPSDVWEKFVTKGLCYGCGGDWDFKGALKVNINSSEYTGYKYYHTKPGYRIKARSCEDARFIHITCVLLAEVRHFEKVSVSFLCGEGIVSRVHSNLWYSSLCSILKPS